MSEFEDFQFGKKKKKINKVAEPIIEDPHIYTYDILIDRIFQQCNQSDENKKYIINPPIVRREGTKKTIWENFPEICKTMKRDPNHVLSFTATELGCGGSLDMNGKCVIRGRFQQKHIESILKKYIHEYVKCHTCKKPETRLVREDRLLFLCCNKCNSRKSVAMIKRPMK